MKKLLITLTMVMALFGCTTIMVQVSTPKAADAAVTDCASGSACIWYWAPYTNPRLDSTIASRGDGVCWAIPSYMLNHVESATSRINGIYLELFKDGSCSTTSLEIAPNTGYSILPSGWKDHVNSYMLF